MKFHIFILAWLLNAAAFAALPGVTEFKTPPEKITDAELSVLLRERVADADVIAIGETVHGSADMLRLQARLLRYLVTQHGLRLIVWENGVLRSLDIAHWAAACSKTKTPAPPPFDALYFPTAADAAWLNWVCEFNLAHPGDPIRFRGMDVWDRPWEHYARIQSLGARAGIDGALLKNIGAICPAQRASTWAQIDAVLAEVQRDRGFAPAAAYEKCRALLTTLHDNARQSALDKQKQKDAGAEDAFELALSASTLLGWLGFYHYDGSNDILSWNERDRAQGRNLALLMAQHNAPRAIVSAHTSHTSHNRTPADWWSYGDLKSGVYFYQQLTQKKVFNIALTAYEASGAQGEWSLPTAANSMDKKLHDAKHAFAFFHANAAFLAEHKKWWMQNQNFPGPFESGVEIVPRDHFDAFFFFSRSHLDKALPARPVWQP
ncbi:MAG: erythromycin esterase family protein [Betaproteobacteria bacterium]|nr:erythromycin esterase family protein [Betaproteobacteria bacterium]